MATRTWIASAGSIVVLVLVACGGNIGVADDGANRGDGGPGTGDGGAGDAAGCSIATLASDRACVPGVARAGVAITIEVNAVEPCLPCFTTLEACDVQVTGSTVTVGLAQKTCTPPGDVGCPTICAIPRTTCTLPPLAAGTYEVKLTGETHPRSARPRELVVAEDADATACTLPELVTNKPAPIEGSRYATTCDVDDDCMAVVTGDPCAVCACPDFAISKISKVAYDADMRERTSQCPADNRGAVCGPCQAAAVACEKGPSDPAGTCKLLPPPPK